MNHRRIILFLALCLLCLVPVIAMGAGSIPVLRAGDTLTVTEVVSLGGDVYQYSVQLPDGSTVYIQSDAIMTDAAAAQMNISAVEDTPKPQMVWIPKSGSKYHSSSSCSNMKNPRQVTKDEAVRKGYGPCKKCH